MFKSRIILAALTAVASFATASAAHVSFLRGNITYEEDFEQGDIRITFAKCMFNNLYTFKSVTLNGIELNTTGSDNIGPFLVGGMWTGGNHGYPNNNTGAKTTAKTLSYTVWADGVELTGSKSVDCSILEVEVVNELYYYTSTTADPSVFAIETMRYRVSGNSIEVWGNHKYQYDKALTVSRYYGMQSMFNNETALLTPGGKMKYWTTFVPDGDANRLEFNKSTAPDFCTYVERNDNGYQASYMTRDGIGDRSMVSDNDIVFTGNNWGKSYHKLIGDRSVKKGDETSWHGIYSWFAYPLTDECDDKTNANPLFVYPAYINGQAYEMRLDASGKMTQVAGIDDIVADCEADFAYALPGHIVISDKAPDASCYSISGTKLHSGSGQFECPAGVYIVTDNHGHSIKLFVK